MSLMVSAELLKIVRCPLCSQRVAPQLDGDSFAVGCPCGHSFPAGAGYLDLWLESPGRASKYQDPNFAVDPAYLHVGPPVLGAGLRLWMLRRLLQPKEGDRVLDLGCGNGKFAFWLHSYGIRAVGVDVAPHFAEEAVKHVDLIRADGRRLPLADNVFTAAYSIDVLEHLDEPSVGLVLSELHRVVEPQGKLFIYSNTKERSVLSPIIAPSRWLQRLFVTRGLIDDTWDRMRKDDHVKPLSTIDDVVSAVARAGFIVDEVTYWNTVFTGFLENVVVKLVRTALTGGRNTRRVRAKGDDPNLPTRLAWRRRYLLPLWTLTQITKLDILLFGRLRAGPYFLLAHKPGG